MSDRDWSIFEAYVGKLMKQESIAGAAVAVSQHGEIIYQKGFGVRDIETKDPVTPDTIFGTASVTKSFTALTIMQLADEGKLSLDDPVICYIPRVQASWIGRYGKRQNSSLAFPYDRFAAYAPQ